MSIENPKSPMGPGPANDDKNQKDLNEAIRLAHEALNSKEKSRKIIKGQKPILAKDAEKIWTKAVNEVRKTATGPFDIKDVDEADVEAAEEAEAIEAIEKAAWESEHKAAESKKANNSENNIDQDKFKNVAKITIDTKSKAKNLQQAQPNKVKKETVPGAEKMSPEDKEVEKMRIGKNAIVVKDVKTDVNYLGTIISSPKNGKVEAEYVDENGKVSKKTLNIKDVLKWKGEKITNLVNPYAKQEQAEKSKKEQINQAKKLTEAQIEKEHKLYLELSHKYAEIEKINEKTAEALAIMEQMDEIAKRNNYSKKYIEGVKLAADLKEKVKAKEAESEQMRTKVKELIKSGKEVAVKDPDSGIFYKGTVRPAGDETVEVKYKDGKGKWVYIKKPVSLSDFLKWQEQPRTTGETVSSKPEVEKNRERVNNMIMSGEIIAVKDQKTQVAYKGKALRLLDNGNVVEVEYEPNGKKRIKKVTLDSLIEWQNIPHASDVEKNKTDASNGTIIKRKSLKDLYDFDTKSEKFIHEKGAAITEYRKKHGVSKPEVVEKSLAQMRAEVADMTKRGQMIVVKDPDGNNYLGRVYLSKNDENAVNIQYKKNGKGKVIPRTILIKDFFEWQKEAVTAMAEKPEEKNQEIVVADKKEALTPAEQKRERQLMSEMKGLTALIKILKEQNKVEEVAENEELLIEKKNEYGRLVGWKTKVSEESEKDAEKNLATESKSDADLEKMKEIVLKMKEEDRDVVVKSRSLEKDVLGKIINVFDNGDVLVFYNFNNAEDTYLRKAVPIKEFLSWQPNIEEAVLVQQPEMDREEMAAKLRKDVFDTRAELEKAKEFGRNNKNLNTTDEINAAQKKYDDAMIANLTFARGGEALKEAKQENKPEVKIEAKSEQKPEVKNAPKISSRESAEQAWKSEKNKGRNAERYGFKDPSVAKAVGLGVVDTLGSVFGARLAWELPLLLKDVYQKGGAKDATLELLAAIPRSEKVEILHLNDDKEPVQGEGFVMSSKRESFEMKVDRSEMGSKPIQERIKAFNKKLQSVERPEAEKQELRNQLAKILKQHRNSSEKIDENKIKNVANLFDMYASVSARVMTVAKETVNTVSIAMMMPWMRGVGYTALAGIDSAYKAYKAYDKENFEIKGKNFTPEKGRMSYIAKALTIDSAKETYNGLWGNFFNKNEKGEKKMSGWKATLGAILKVVSIGGGALRLAGVADFEHALSGNIAMKEGHDKVMEALRDGKMHEAMGHGWENMKLNADRLVSYLHWSKNPHEEYKELIKPKGTTGDATVAEEGIQKSTGTVAAMGKNIQETSAEDVEKIKELARVPKGGGIVQVVRGQVKYQIEHNPKAFGYNGDIHDGVALHKFAGEKAYNIAVKNHYIDLDKGTEIRVLEDKNPTLFILNPDNSIKEVNAHTYIEDMRQAAKKSLDDAAAFAGRKANFENPSQDLNNIFYGETPNTSHFSNLDKARIDLDNKIDANNTKIDELQVAVAKEARRHLATGNGLPHSQFELDKAISKANALASERERIEQQIHSINDNTSSGTRAIGEHAGKFTNQSQNTSHFEHVAKVKETVIDTTKDQNYFTGRKVVFDEGQQVSRTTPHSNFETTSHDDAGHVASVSKAETGSNDDVSVLPDKVTGVHEGAIVLDNKSKLIFKYDDKNEIIDVSSKYMSGAEDVAGIKKMLSPDWFNVLKNNIKGTQSLIMAKEEVEMQTKNMFFENKALQQLIDSGRGDGAEANFLRKHMAKVTYSLITKYKDVVDTKFATAVGQAALNVKDEYEE